MRRCFEQLQPRTRFSGFWAASPQSSLKLHYNQNPSITKTPAPVGFTSLNRPLLFFPGHPPRDVPNTRSTATASRTAAKKENTSKVEQSRHAEPTELPRNDPKHWVALLEKFLPNHLSDSNQRESRTIFPFEFNFKDVLRILTEGRLHSKGDILVFMVLEERRYKAVYHITDILLKAVALVVNKPFQDELPSNIDWPDGSLSKYSKGPIELEFQLNVNRRRPETRVQSSDSLPPERDHEHAMELIWSLLAGLVIASTKRPLEESRQIMNTVHQILALLHNLALVPETIYTFCLPRETSTLQHPPILQLLNSRILSTLSDAVWRAYQDEAIERTGRRDFDLRNFFQDPPGSRFRLKVRELGPEVWLEFILWCCVEGGLYSLAARIIASLRQEAEGPWHAVHWTPGQGLDNRAPPIDWNRVKNRTGGPVGQIEGYSFDKPLAEIPSKTISAELVLAIADGLINSVDFGIPGLGLTLDKVSQEISDVVSFLEPHGLAPAYFDYLAVRLLQTGCLYGSAKVNALRDWVSAIQQLRNMQPADEQHRQRRGLAFDAVLDRSELQAGILHQVLQACIESNLVTKAVDTFTDIQKLVDINKLEAIAEFFSLPFRPRDGFFTSRLAKGQTEFISSFGQLPTYRMTPFLNMVTRAKLFGLGDWLLFSADVDGAVLPSSTWSRPSVAVAVCRYAAVKNDASLIQSIFTSIQNSTKMPTVNFLRGLVTYHIKMRKWGDAVSVLQELRASEGGGYSPGIVANLADSVLRLEFERDMGLQNDSDSDLFQAISLLRDMLRGEFDSPKSSFRILQRTIFRQQVGYLLRLLENIPDSKMQDVAHQYKRRFPVSNAAKLAPETFNVVFSAIVETKGVTEGRNIWYLFCKDPRIPTASTDVPVSEDDVVSQNKAPEEDDGEFRHSGLSSASADDTVKLSRHDGTVLQPSSNSSRIDSDSSLVVDGEIVLDEQGSTPLVHPLSIHLNRSISTSHSLGKANHDLPSVPNAEDESDAVILVPTDTNDLGSADLNPIVIPDMRTLQILVTGALTEKVARERGSKQNHADLDELLRWAESFYGAFNLSQEDIESEFRISASLPDSLLVPQRRPRQWRRREQYKVDVASHFNRGNLSPALSDGQSPTGKTILTRAENKTGAKERGSAQQKNSVSPVPPNFHIRRFPSTSP